jgi:quaternary ammonium compound-resistance protein SugE
MAWFFLLVAGLIEIAWTAALKYSEGFNRFWPTTLVIGLGFLSLYFLSLATKELPIGISYTIWVGIGALGASVLGVFLFNEPASFLKLLFLGFILLGIIGLKVTT